MANDKVVDFPTRPKTFVRHTPMCEVGACAHCEEWRKWNEPRMNDIVVNVVLARRLVAAETVAQTQYNRWGTEFWGTVLKALREFKELTNGKL